MGTLSAGTTFPEHQKRKADRAAARKTYLDERSCYGGTHDHAADRRHVSEVAVAAPIGLSDSSESSQRAATGRWWTCTSVDAVVALSKSSLVASQERSSRW